MAAFALLVAFFAVRGPQPAWDGSHLGAGWELVQKANKAVNPDEVVKAVAGSKATLVAQIEVSSGDFDATTTKALAAALQAGNTDAAAKLLEAAQKPPGIEDALTKGNATKANERMSELIGASKPASITPKIDAALAESIKEGATRLFSMYLYDPCAEDGDIVCLTIHAQPFAMVPLTRRGAALTIPITSTSPNGVRLVGIRDGGGGITVAFQTGAGSYVCRTIQPGAELPINIAPEKAW